jgi:hypothetical protein
VYFVLKGAKAASPVGSVAAIAIGDDKHRADVVAKNSGGAMDDAWKLTATDTEVESDTESDIQHQRWLDSMPENERRAKLAETAEYWKLKSAEEDRLKVQLLFNSLPLNSFARGARSSPTPCQCKITSRVCHCCCSCHYR